MIQNDEARVECSEKLLSLLEDLSNPVFYTEDRKHEVAKRISEIYIKKGGFIYKHQYSEVSRFLYGKKADVDACTLICDALDEARECINNDRLLQCIDKLIDHITLESLRIGQMDNVLKQTEQLSRVIDEAKKLVKDADALEKRQATMQTENEKLSEEIIREKEDVESTLEEVHAHNIQTVVTLSIFACVVFAFTGGFTIIGNSLSTITNIEYNKAPFFLACITLLALVMYDVIHMLLFYTSKMTGKEPNDKTFPWVNCVCIAIAIVLLLFYYYLHQ